MPDSLFIRVISLLGRERAWYSSQERYIGRSHFGGGGKKFKVVIFLYYPKVVVMVKLTHHKWKKGERSPKS